MTYALWPLRADFDASASSGAPMSQLYSFQTDSAIPVDRLRSTARVEIWTLRTRPILLADLATFEAWFDGDIGFGVSRFVMPHPRKGTFHLWRLHDGEPPYTVSQPSGESFAITMRVMMLPAILDQDAYIVTPDGMVQSA